MAYSFERTGIWQRTLAPQTRDADSEARDLLRVALLSMREHAKWLVERITNDCPGLTVHDVSHLDALWDIADEIAGPEFELNPVEAFIFGASVLLHDAGMTIAAYEGGLAALSELPEWRDAATAYAKPFLNGSRADPQLRTVPKEVREAVIFDVLRRRHAAQAEALLSVQFKKPKSRHGISLLEHTGLREAFGSTIGRIAHSHHWDIQELQEKLSLRRGSATFLPREWTLNEIRVACLLRCADAAHLDNRRAPTIPFALSSPTGVSATHWNFQNRLNRITRAHQKIVFSSGEVFASEDAGAWWMCYETAQMVDGEIRRANALMQEMAMSSFAADGVAGIESPALFSSHVRVSNWKPISAEVRVSDPVHLAKTLGGENLYGDDNLVPIRELLQNAADAIRARRAQEDRQDTWGIIQLELEEVSEDETWLHVDDNGIGMSERVLSGPLIDFGKSFWNSSLLRDEFPGLQSKGLQTTGKFGIGFFAIFLLGEAVRVASRRFDAGQTEARVLEFEELTRRPILKPASVGSIPPDFSTRVSVKLNEIEEFRRSGERWGSVNSARHDGIFDRLRSMISGLDVCVSFRGYRQHAGWVHEADWQSKDSALFLKEVLADRHEAFVEEVIGKYSERVMLVYGDNGEVLGRAVLVLPEDDNKSLDALASVGGFAAGRLRAMQSGPPGMLGVLVADTDDISRGLARILATDGQIGIWASEQAGLVGSRRFKHDIEMEIAETVLDLGGDPGELVCAYLGGSFRTFSEVKAYIASHRQLLVPLNNTYDTEMEIVEIGNMSPDYILMKTRPDVLIMNTDSYHDSIDSDLSRRVMQTGDSDLEAEELQNIVESFMPEWLGHLIREWPSPLLATIERLQIFDTEFISQPPMTWCLKVRASN